MYFLLESILSWCIQSKTEQNKALYIFSNRLYSEPFSLNFGAPIYYLEFLDSGKIYILLFYMRDHTELVYILQNRVEQCIVYFFLTDYIQRNFVFNIGLSKQYLDFFNSGKIKIFLFDMTEDTELMYIQQNRV